MASYEGLSSFQECVTFIKTAYTANNLFAPQPFLLSSGTISMLLANTPAPDDFGQRRIFVIFGIEGFWL